MPKNYTGGKGHRSNRNSESSTSKKNKKFFDDLLSDIRGGEDLEGIHIGRIVRKLGEGRMEVMYYVDGRSMTANAPIKGSLRGRGKRDAFMDINSIVVLSELGVDSGTTHEIFTVLNPSQVAMVRKEIELDDRLFANDVKEDVEGTFEFERQDEEVNIDAI
jgi:hypothetical protein